MGRYSPASASLARRPEPSAICWRHPLECCFCSLRRGPALTIVARLRRSARASAENCVQAVPSLECGHGSHNWPDLLQPIRHFYRWCRLSRHRGSNPCQDSLPLGLGRSRRRRVTTSPHATYTSFSHLEQCGALEPFGNPSQCQHGSRLRNKRCVRNLQDARFRFVWGTPAPSGEPATPQTRSKPTFSRSVNVVIESLRFLSLAFLSIANPNPTNQLGHLPRPGV